MVVSIIPLDIRWEKLPEDYVLPDDPVDNIAQPALAAALTDALTTAGQLPTTAMTCTNYGICATVNDRVVVKAPDWAYIPHITASQKEVHQSYTPQLQGEIPLIVMEFLSDAEGTEYSVKPTYPPGKWFFYEQVLGVPYYALFDLSSGRLECYCLAANSRYELVESDEQGRYWIADLGLFLGIWSGQRENRDSQWLRWWDAAGNLLLWSSERLVAEQKRAEKLAAQLRSLGIDPEIV